MGEVDVHLGLFELDESAAALLAIKNHATHGNGDCVDTAAGHRGDGEGVALDAAGQSGTIGASANEATSKFNEEHFNAIIWRYRLKKMPLAMVCGLLSKMPRECVDSAVADYRKRETSISQANRTIIHKFLTRRDHISNRKVDVAKHSADFCEAKFGPLTPGTWEQFRAGKSLPAGWFIAYKNAHPQLANACGNKTGNSSDHQRVLKLYKRAVKVYAAEKQRSALAQHSQGAHRGDGGGN